MRHLRQEMADIIFREKTTRFVVSCLANFSEQYAYTGTRYITVFSPLAFPKIIPPSLFTRTTKVHRAVSQIAS